MAALSVTPVQAQSVATTFRTGEHPAKTRFVLEFSEKPEYTIFTLDEPYRIVIDFKGVDWQVAPSLHKRGQGVIKGIRNGSSDASNHRVVLDLAGPALVLNDFMLDPDDGYPWLFVLDLSRTSRAAFQTARNGIVAAPASQMARAPAVAPLFPPLQPGPRTIIAEDTSGAVFLPEQPMGELVIEPAPQVSSATVAAAVAEVTRAPPPPARPIEKPEALDRLRSLASLVEFSGNVELEGRGFFYDGRTPNFGQTDHSMSAEVKVERYWNNDRQSFTFVPFFRWDDNDHERTHFDIREMRWVGAFGDFEFKAGIDKVFWGVTEAVHLIDIINQTDQVEDPDLEDKLGQLMVNATYLSKWGVFEAYVLPGFRPRTFGSATTRVTNGGRISNNFERYESGAGDKHVDYAVRWSQSFDEWDLGVAHFYGTSRDPRFILEFDNAGPLLVPFYDQIHQSSLDIQWTHEAWLLKFEGLRREGQGKTYYASASGFEYSFFSVFNTAADLGIVGEYLYDNRNDRAPTPFENDVFVGGRWTANDIQDLNILAGVIIDLDSDGRMASVEASRRLGQSWKLSLDVRFFDSIPAKDPLYPARADDFIQLRIARFF